MQLSKNVNNDTITNPTIYISTFTELYVTNQMGLNFKKIMSAVL